MRVDITFNDFQTKETEHKALLAAQAFINDGLGDRFYGPGMTWIEVAVQSRAKPGRKLKRFRKYKGSFAEHVYFEVIAEFGPARELTLEDFCAAIELVRASVGDSGALWSGPFQLDAFGADLRELAQSSPVSQVALVEYASSVPSLKNQITLKWLRAEERRRFEHPRPRTRPIRGLRCYPRGRLEKALEPYAQNYCLLFEGLLTAQQWMTPGYDEIYVNLDESDQLARIRRTAIESWHENAYGVIQLDEFLAADPAIKEAMVRDAYGAALRGLAEIDHLDRDALESVIARVAQEGLQTDLLYVRKENATHRARILYRLREDGGTPAFRLEVTETATGRVAERPLDVRPEEMIWLAYRFSRLELTKKQVRIVARTGVRAQISLQSTDRPPLMAFELDELFPRAGA